MTDRKAVIKNADMSEDMQTDAVECATQALEKYNIEKDIAAFIKKEFDKKYRYLEFLRKFFPKFFIEILALEDFDFFGKIVFFMFIYLFFQPNLALHCWPQLWQLRYPRDQALYLFLFGTGTFIFDSLAIFRWPRGYSFTKIIFRLLFSCSNLDKWIPSKTVCQTTTKPPYTPPGGNSAQS